MAVDLKSGGAGIVQLADGRRFYCMHVTQYGSDVPDTHSVRVESGGYNLYHSDGRAVNPNAAAIVSFTPCAADDPRAANLPTEA